MDHPAAGEPKTASVVPGSSTQGAEDQGAPASGAFTQCPPVLDPRPRYRRRRLEAKYRRRRVAVGGAALAVVMTATVGIVAAGKLQSNLSSAPIREEGTGIAFGDEHGTNLLILGSDTRDLDGDSYGDADGARSDAMVLAHLSANERRIDAVQIPRDTMMELPACPDTGAGASEAHYGVVNAALNFGPSCSVAAIEALSGVHIDHFIEMNFEGFQAMVDAMDGLPVCLPEPLEDPRANLDLPAGEQVVSGEDALALARTRHAVGDGSDIARMGHQQQVMSAIVQRAKSTDVLTRPDRLYGFLDAVTSSITVDPELDSLTALAALARTAAGVENEQITFSVMPWEAEENDSNRVVAGSGAAEVFARIGEDVPIDGSEPEPDSDAGLKETDAEDDLPAPPQSPVAVENASTLDGRAGDLAQVLEEKGFAVSGTSTAARFARETTVRFDGSRRARETADALVERLDLDLAPVEGLQDGVVVVLGTDVDDVLGLGDGAGAGGETDDDERSADGSAQPPLDSSSADSAMCG